MPSSGDGQERAPGPSLSPAQSSRCWSRRAAESALRFSEPRFQPELQSGRSAFRIGRSSEQGWGCGGRAPSLCCANLSAARSSLRNAGHKAHLKMKKGSDRLRRPRTRPGRRRSRLGPRSLVSIRPILPSRLLSGCQKPGDTGPRPRPSASEGVTRDEQTRGGVQETDACAWTATGARPSDPRVGTGARAGT